MSVKASSVSNLIQSFL